MNFCLCGAEAGYPHAADCPRPLYRCSDSQAARWHADRAALPPGDIDHDAQDRRAAAEERNRRPRPSEY